MVFHPTENEYLVSYILSLCVCGGT